MPPLQRVRRGLALLLALAMWSLQPASAAAEPLIPVDVELVLLADASGSIDNAEIRFQREGYAEAIMHPDVLYAISGGAYARVAVTFIEWGDMNHQKVVVPWMVVSDRASAAAFAETLRTTPRLAYGRNAIGAALAEAQRQIENNRFDGHRKVIDFSGDSANSWNGIAVEVARERALRAGITINGLAILCRQRACSGSPVGYDLEEAFSRQIIGGPGAFVVSVDGTDRFAAVVRRKLILELAENRATPQP